MKGKLFIAYRSGEATLSGTKKLFRHDSEELDVQDVSAQGAFLVVETEKETIFLPQQEIHRATFTPKSIPVRGVVGPATSNDEFSF